MKNNKLQKTKSGIYSFFDWFYKLVVLNFTFILFVLFGGIITSLGPALRASHYIMGKWINKEEPRFLKTFWSVYYKDYFHSFFTTIPYLIVFSLLALSFYSTNTFLKATTIGVFTFFSAVAISLFFVTSFMFVFFFKHRYNISFSKSLKLSFSLPFGRIWYLLIILILEFVLFFLTIIIFKFFLIFLNLGLYFFIIEFFANIAFKKIEIDKIDKDKNLEEDLEIIMLKNELKQLEEQKRRKKELKKEFKQKRENKKDDKNIH